MRAWNSYAPIYLNIMYVSVCVSVQKLYDPFSRAEHIIPYIVYSYSSRVAFYCGVTTDHTTPSQNNTSFSMTFSYFVLNRTSFKPHQKQLNTFHACTSFLCVCEVYTLLSSGTYILRCVRFSD